MSTATAVPIAEYPIWCKGCRTIQRFSSFLTYVDPACYRVHVQCRQCLQKSTESYRRHRDDIKAARQAREQVCERVACVCGVTINVRYRDRHCQSKRHQTVVALLRYANARPPAPAEAEGGPSASGAPEGQAQEPYVTPTHTVRSRYRPSLPRLDESTEVNHTTRST